MYRHHVMEAEQQGIRLARGLAAAHEKMVQNTHALLRVMTHKAFTLDLDNPQCWDVLADLMKEPGLAAYTAAAFFSPQGDLICNSIRPPGPLNAADREWFKRALDTGEFAIGGYQVGRTSGRAMVPFAHPVVGPRGDVVGVAMLALGVDWLEGLVAQTTVPHGARVVILDGDGVVLTDYPSSPDQAGQRLAVPWLAEVLGSPEGVLSRTDLWGEDVLVAHVPLTEANASVLVILDKTAHIQAAAESLTREMVALLFILVGASVSAWFGSSLIVRPIQRLVSATHLIGSGHSLPPEPAAAAPVELDSLLASFKTMAEQLRQHEAEISDGRRLMEALLVSVGEGICGMDLDGRVIFANPEALRLTGWSQEEFVGARMHALIHHTRPDGSPHPAEECPMRKAAVQGIPAKVSDDVMWRRDGTSFDVEYTVTPLTSAAGKLEGAVVVFRDISVRKRQEELIAHMAGHDALTDLPNRKLFEDRLTFAIRQARRNQRHVAVMYLDLDKFKPVNDSLGHSAGDIVLREVALRLQDCVRETDTVARLGGDEFVALISNLTADEAVGPIAEKMVAAINRPIDVNGRSVTVGTSIGIAVYPSHAGTEEQLIRRADEAMYAAKASGRNRYRFAMAEEVMNG